MTEQTKSAVVTLPSWFWGSNPEGFFKSADIYARCIDRTANKWRIKTNEAYFQRRPRLVTSKHLAGPSVGASTIGDLTELANTELMHDIPERIAYDVYKQSERAAKTNEPVDWLSTWSAQTLIATPSELSETVKSIYEQLGHFTLEDDPYHILFQNRGVHVIMRRPEIHHRIKLIMVLLRVMYDERLAHGDTSHIATLLGNAGLTFNSSAELTNGSLLLDAYLEPLCSSLAPAIWCFPIQRESCAIIYSLGQPLAGTRNFASELLQLLPVQGSQRTVPVPQLSRLASLEAITWWSDGLNSLFSVVTDPTIFVDRDGNYLPTEHLHAVLTVEQLFRRVHSIQSSYRDTNARRVLLFTVLDTLERLTGRKLETHCTLSFAQKTVSSLREIMPPHAAEVLLPGAERAVAALKDLQSGFFMRSDSDPTHIDVPLGDERVKHLTLEDAASQYIKIQRDATHGHGSNKSHLLARINALLTYHDGSFPHDLALLGYLYLLDVIANPDRLRRKLSNVKRDA